MNVLIIPEDFRKDQYMLKPIFQRLFEDLGKSRARIVFCNPPLLGGVSEALKLDRIQEIIEMYPMVDIFILCVDRDGEKNRRQRLDFIEKELKCEKAFFAENAWEEIETWVLAGVTLPPNWNWADVRSALHVKELFFEPFAKIAGVEDGPGGGRKALGEQASRRIDSILLKCREDFAALADRLRGFVQ